MRLNGEVAVVTGRWHARGVDAGRAFDHAARYASLGVRRDGGWQMVSGQSTPISGS